MTMMGIDPQVLPDDVLLRELRHLHRTRHETFLHGPDDALDRHTSRTSELESEYLRRHPVRDIDPGRLRP